MIYILVAGWACEIFAFGRSKLRPFFLLSLTQQRQITLVLILTNFIKNKRALAI